MVFKNAIWERLENKIIGSGALSVLIVKISLGGVFFLFLAHAGGSNPAGHYPFPNHAGQS